MNFSTIPLSTISPADRLTTACLLEAVARKPGNVHPFACAGKLTFDHFVDAARITGQELGRLSQAPPIDVGAAILSAIKATREQTGTNVNLGIVLLLAPLAAVPVDQSLKDGMASVLDNLTMDDTRQIYEAIQTAQPGGMGEVQEEDVAESPTRSIQYAMSLASSRDSIARQYCNHFEDVLTFGRDSFQKWWSTHSNWEVAVIGTHLELMARFPDSLIARKCGPKVAAESSRRAQAVVDANWPGTATGNEAIDQLDNWLRADGNRRNPGTTADLIAAVLFSLLRDRLWIPPAVIEIDRS